ncbi:MAG: hypothetical protein DYG94_01315 [Leptolyngbya sp. PLA3]|nr:MAG: hypothetical protein EDM82_00565 [Cyanobacteria bacterium CYA]MCE7967370.1 hypothetical protein [Leptolyngbya sp. PL-A3]
MEEKVEQRTESRDMTERVEEMLSAIDATCNQIDRLTEAGPALTPEMVADAGAQLASDLTCEASGEPEPAASNDAGVLNAEQRELAESDSGFVLEDLGKPSEPEQAVDAAAAALNDAVESVDDLSNDLATLANALSELKTEEEASGGPVSDEPVPAVPPTEESVAASPARPFEADGAQSIEELDSELASLADAVLEGAFEDAAGHQTEAGAPPAAVMSAPAGPPIEPRPSTRAEAPIEATESAEPEAEPQPARASVASLPPPGAQPEPEPVEPAVLPEPTVTATAPKTSPAPATARSGRFAGVAAAAHAAEPGTRKVWLVTRPALASALLAISKPAAKLPRSQRDTIGWFAVYTAFLAVCVWGFLLLFRKPSVPVPSSDPVGILGEPAPSENS